MLRHDFSVVLNSDGSVTLSWMSADSAASTGAFFAVSRKLPGQGAQYIVQGFRGTRTGDASDAVTVQFGTDSGGGLASASLKMAA